MHSGGRVTQSDSKNLTLVITVLMIRYTASTAAAACHIGTSNFKMCHQFEGVYSMAINHGI